VTEASKSIAAKPPTAPSSSTSLPTAAEAAASPPAAAGSERTSPPSTRVPRPSAAERAARARGLVDDAKKIAANNDERRARDRARDQELVDRAKKGDTAAFQKLVIAHQGRLFSVAFGMLRDRDEAMDVVQDAFIKAHRKLAEFEGNAAFSTWLYRIAVNLSIDRKRADARRRKTDIDDAAGKNLDDDPLYAAAEFAPRLSGSNPLRNSTDKELGKQIDTAMAKLTEDHRAIVLLREVEGMSYEEIAETLGVPKGTVMSRLFHARKNLQRVLRPILGIEDGMGLDGKPTEEGRNLRSEDPVAESAADGEQGPSTRRPKKTAAEKPSGG
jgi:RNA polymerase sigma-70 factor (ECF subfamily)